MSNTNKKCAIIGAGASGLPSARWAKEYGYTTVIFEHDSHLGGLWYYKPEKTKMGSVMRSTTINTSKEMTAYSDFPPNENYANFMHHSDMLNYFKEYVQKYDLMPNIRFNHTVLNVRRSENYTKNGEWIVEFSDAAGVNKEERFNCVLLCQGHHNTPNMNGTNWPGIQNFTGRLIHSHDYRTHVGYENKTCVVVGIGNSALDVAVELGHVSGKAYLSTRRGAWIHTRAGKGGYPNDMLRSPRFKTKFLTRILPFWVREWLYVSEVQERIDHVKYGLKPEHSIYSQHVSMNDELPNRLISGTVIVKPDIKEIIGGNTIVWADGTTTDGVDEIICGTGYLFDLDIIEHGNLVKVTDNKTNLYKYMFPVELMDHNTLATIGLIQPVGSIMPIAEMQARVFFEQLEKRIKLPTKQEMIEDINCRRNATMKRFVNSDRHTIQVDFVAFLDELAEMIGAVPNVLRYLITDPKLAYTLLFEANVPYVYRLNGPHSWKGARNAILKTRKRVEIAHMTRKTSPLKYLNCSPNTVLLFIEFSIILFLLFVYLF